jgi:hypothetical protein
MKRVVPGAGFAILMTFAFTPGGLAEGPVSLRYKFHEGQTLTYRLRVTQSMDLSMDPMGTSTQPSTMHTDVDIAQKVLGIEGNTALLELAFKRFSASQVVDNKKLPLSGTEGIERIRLGMKMSPLGQMKQPVLLNPDAIDEPARKLAESMRRSVEQNSLILPEKPLHQGDTWIIEKEAPAHLPGAPEMKMKLSSQYKLLGFETIRGIQCAQISADVSLVLKGEVKRAGIPLRADLEGKGKGMVLFDIEGGRMIDSTAELGIAGSIRADSQGQSVETRVKIHLDVRVELKP